MPEFYIKRAYEPAADGDGFRAYIDRIWPRGMSHANFKYNLWDKDIAPSAELRRWFHEDPAGRWEEFEKRYAEELKTNPALDKFREMISGIAAVTLLYSSKDKERNNALVLKKFLESSGS